VPASRVPLTREKLRDAIDGHGLVYDRATDYRRAVDEALFGLGEHRYEALINLLIQLRQPQLSKRPDEKLLSEMGAFNQELIKAGVMKDGAGLKPTSKGARVSFAGGTPTVTDGPFAETKELIAGYWIWEVKSKQEAIEWAKKIPFKQLPNQGRAPEVEIRQFYELEDFQDVPPQVAEAEKAFRK